MKFIVNLKNHIFLITFLILFSSVLLLAKNTEEVNADMNFESLKEKSLEERTKTTAPKKALKKNTKTPPKFRASSETSSKAKADETNTAAKKPVRLSDKAYSMLNNTLVGNIDISIPKTGVELKNRNWDFKMLAKQTEDLLVDMNYASMKGVTTESMRSFQHLFITPFEKCDLDIDSLPSLKEFTKCLKIDTYLNRIEIPNYKFPLKGSTLKYKNFNNYAKLLYGIYDDAHLNICVRKKLRR